MSTPPVPKKPNAQRTAYAGRLAPFTGSDRAPNHMKDDELTTMNFKVPVDFHTDFKLTAVQHGISMRQLLEESFHMWVEHKRGS